MMLVALSQSPLCQRGSQLQVELPGRWHLLLRKPCRELAGGARVLSPCAGRFSHCCGPAHVEQSPFVRVSFASATHAELREGMARLGATLRGAQGGGAAGQNGHVNLEAGKASALAGVAAAAPPAVGAVAKLPARDASGQNGQVSPAAGKALGLLREGLQGMNGHAGGPEAIDGAQNAEEGLGKQARAAQEGMQGLRVSQDAGPDAGRAEPMQDAAAKVELASGSPEVTADALASRPAKTLKP